MKVALVYDRVNKWGGAERVLLALHELFPNAPLYTSVYNSHTAAWAKVFPLHASFLQHIPFAKSRHEYLPFLMPLAFENFSFDEYDLVISVTSEAAKGIITRPGTKHICICLTPTRYLWSGYAEYFSNRLLAFLVRPVVWYLRLWDSIAAQRPDMYIAISEEVRTRIKQYYNRDAIVVYPPLSLLEDISLSPVQKGEYFLVVSRLSRFTKYKRVDLAVEAATKLSLPLKVVGDGDSRELKKKAGPTVEFVGRVNDQELMDYYAHAKALIFPGKEDFGLVMLEAQAAGKPVIAFKGGGALEIVQEGKTGAFFERQTVGSLVEVLKSFSETSYNSQVCCENAARFGKDRFKREIADVLKSESIL